jgi:hypothetical protein
MASKDSVPKSGKGSEASRLSDSRLAIRRGNTDPTDIDDTPLTLGFSERHDYENTLKPSAPIAETGAGEGHLWPRLRSLRTSRPRTRSRPT